MKGHPVHGYFSNFIDDKGYLMTFPVQLADVSVSLVHRLAPPVLVNNGAAWCMSVRRFDAVSPCNNDNKKYFRL